MVTYTRTDAEKAFETLANIFGKRTLVNGRESPSDTGAWIFHYEPANDTVLIKELTKWPDVFNYPLGYIAVRPSDFVVAASLIVHAIDSYKNVYPAHGGVPPGEVYGARLPKVRVAGKTFYRDDVRREFREVGHPERGISFEEWEITVAKGPERSLRAEFNGNIAIMTTNLGAGYETTNQWNVIQAISNWLYSGILAPYEAGPETQKSMDMYTNWLSIEKTRDAITISDNVHQRRRYRDMPTAISAVRSWVFAGQLP